MLTTRSGSPLQAYKRLVLSLSPAAWFRAGEGQTVTGSGVSQWSDQSGNARHLLQGTDAARPALQVDGSVLFDGSSDFLATSNFTLGAQMTIVAVVKQVSYTGGDYLWDCGASNINCAMQQNTITPNVRAVSDNGTKVSTQLTNLAIGVIGVAGIVLDNTNSVVFVNSTKQTSQNLGTTGGGKITIGASFSGANNGNAQFYEVVAFAAALTTTQLDALVTQMMAIYSVS